MKIVIPFSSKMSNSFSDQETKKPTAVSLGAIQDSIKNEKVVIEENDTYEDIMFKINKVHPNFQYNPIDKNTVLGVFARLVGETRYLKDVLSEEPEHIINKLKEKISFNIYDRELSNEIIRIATPEKEVQNNGAGLIKESAKEHILLSENKISKLLYSVFNLNTIEDMENFLSVIETAKDCETVQKFFDKNNFDYQEKFSLINFLSSYNNHADRVKSYDKSYRDLMKKAEKEKTTLETIMTKDVERYINLLKKMGKINKNDESAYFVPKFIMLPGVLLYTIIDFLISIDLKKNIVNKLIEEKNNNMKGIAVLSGGLTIKDFYSAFVESKKTTSNSPYFLNAKFFDKKNNKSINQSAFNLGITKEDGLLEITIDVSEEEAIELKEMIKNVGVASFQLGKKGLAYVKEISVFK